MRSTIKQYLLIAGLVLSLAGIWKGFLYLMNGNETVRWSEGAPRG